MTETQTNPPAWGVHSPTGLAARWLRLLHALPVTRTWRRLALWLRKPLKNALGTWVDLEVWGLKLRLRSQGNLSEQRMIFMPQFLDTAERMAIKAALQNGGIFFDIGANAGVYSLWVASLNIPGVRVEAFEPDPDLCQSLRFNLTTNTLDSVHLNPLALGRHEGRVHLVSGVGNKGENHIESSQSSVGLAVEMTTLPRFIETRGIRRIDALKIDIEGHECEVLEPFFSQAPRSAWPELLICEVVHDAQNQLARLLDQMGYRLAARGRLNGIYHLPS